MGPFQIKIDSWLKFTNDSGVQWALNLQMPQNQESVEFDIYVQNRFIDTFRRMVYKVQKKREYKITRGPLFRVTGESIKYLVNWRVSNTWELRSL